MPTMASSKLVSSLQICICALLFLGSPSVVWARFSPAVAGSSDLADLGGGHAGGRGLLQSSVTSCPFDFSTVDYSSVTSVCKAPNYDDGACCAPFSKLACQYKPQINDFNSLCPMYFMAYLNVAGNYPAGVFVGNGRCNNGDSLCST